MPNRAEPLHMTCNPVLIAQVPQSRPEAVLLGSYLLFGLLMCGIRACDHEISKHSRPEQEKT